MRLASLELKAFRGVPDGSHSFVRGAGAPASLVLVTGPAASGKTGFLEAIAGAKEAVGPYGTAPSNVDDLRAGEQRGHVAATWWFTDNERIELGLAANDLATRWALGRREEPDRPIAPRVHRAFATFEREDTAGSKFEYFPANRTSALGGRQRPPSRSTDMRERLKRSSEKYAWVRQFLVERAAETNRRVLAELADHGVVMQGTVDDPVRPFQQALGRLLPDLRFARAADPGVVEFVTRGGTVIELARLSDFEQQAVVFAAAFVHLGLNNAVVLIDVPELFVPPQHQAAFLRALLDLGGGQVFVATSSEGMLREFPEAARIELRIGAKSQA